MSILATTFDGVTRTTISGGTALRRPYWSARAGPMYRAAIRVAQVRSWSGSVETFAVPASVTKLNGGRSSSQHNDTRGSRRIALPLTLSAEVVKTTSSPSTSTQTGATWGDPSARTTDSFAVRTGVAS